MNKRRIFGEKRGRFFSLVGLLLIWALLAPFSGFAKRRHHREKASRPKTAELKPRKYMPTSAFSGNMPYRGNGAIAVPKIPMAENASGELQLASEAEELQWTLTPDDRLSQGEPLVTNSVGLWNLEIPELAQARHFYDLGKIDEAVWGLKGALIRASESALLQEALTDLLVARSDQYMLEASRGNITASLSAFFEKDISRELLVHTNRIDLWRCYMGFLAMFPDEKDRFVNGGMRLFINHWVALSSEPLERWIFILQRLEAQVAKMDQPMLRHEILQLLARYPATASFAKDALKGVVQELHERMLESTDAIEVAVKQGKIDEAGFCLMVLDQIAPDSLPLKNAWDCFFREKNLQFYISQGESALQLREFSQAEEFYRQAIEIASKDSRLENLRTRFQPDSCKKKATPPTLEMLSRKDALMGALARADGEDEVATAARILKELRDLGMTDAGQKKRLESLQYQMLAAKKQLPERWDEACRLFREMEWEKLHRLINRNPLLFSDPNHGRLGEEMVFSIRYFLNLDDGEKLKGEARRLCHIYPDCFYPKIAAMEQALKEGNEAEAGVLFERATRVFPDHPLLKQIVRQLKIKRNRVWGLGLLLAGGTLVGGFSLRQILKSRELISSEA